MEKASGKDIAGLAGVAEPFAESVEAEAAEEVEEACNATYIYTYVSYSRDTTCFSPLPLIRWSLISFRVITHKGDKHLLETFPL